MIHVLHNIPKIVHGFGAISRAGAEIARFGGKRAFIVTDPGIAAIGLLKPLEASLSAASITFEVFDKAELEPSAAKIKKEIML
jgi:alcohol dehydrogenase